MRTKNRKIIMLFGVIMITGMLAAACGSNADTNGGAQAPGPGGGGGDEAPVDEGEPISGGFLKAHMVSDADTLDPHASGSFNVHDRVGAASNRLLKPDMDPKYEYGEAPLVGDLAERWEISDDQLTYTFYLRDDVFWHDIAPVNGRQFVADDVLATFERVREMGHQSYMLENVDSIEVPDDFTVVFNLSEPFAPLLNYLGNHFMWIMPREGVEGEYDVAKMVIGTGPFIMTKWEQNVTTEYVANPNYFEEGIPRIDGFSLPVIAETGARVAAFRAGELDLISSIDPREKDSILSSIPGSRLYSYLSFSPTNLYINTAVKPFDDIRVRKAMSMAIDREAGAEALFRNWSYTGPVNTHLTKFALPQEELAELLPYDPERAKELLAEAGYPDGFSTKLIVTNGYGPVVVSGAEWLVADLAEIGIKVELELLDYATYWSNRWSLQNYEIGYGPITPFMEPDEWLRSQLGTGSPRNWFGISSPELDEMLDEQISIMDEDERIEKVQDIQRYVIENIMDPIPTWLAVTELVLGPDVRGYHYQPQYGLNPYKYLWLDRS